MNAIERAYIEGFRTAFAKVAGISLPDGPDHLHVEQLSKFLRSGAIENELSQSVDRTRVNHDSKPVSWGPKASLEGQNNGQADRGMSYGGAI